MAINFGALSAEIDAKIVAVWPEIKPSGTNPNTGGAGVIEVDQVERIAFDRIKGKQYAVLEWQKIEDDDTLLTVEQYQVTLGIHYIKQITDTNIGGISAVRDRLTTLTAALNDASYQPTSCDILWAGGIETGDSHPANRVFIDKGMPWCAGSLSVELLLTETGS